MNKDTILTGCEVLCLTGDLVGCPLPPEEQKVCKQRLQYQAGIREVTVFLIPHKEYQRRWRGGIQLLFGLTPDEFDVLRRGEIPNWKNGGRV